MMSKTITYVTDADFEEKVLQSDIPVLVDFLADWCAPCKSIEPAVKEIAKEYQGKVIVVKMDVSDNPKTTRKYAVKSVPTFIIFKDGEVVDIEAGLSSKAKISTFIDVSIKV